MKKHSAPTEETPEPTPPETKKKSEYFELRIPRIALNKLPFRRPSLNLYLIFVLLLFAFLLGMLTNKVMYLEKQVKDQAAQAAQIAAANAAGGQAQPTVPPYANVTNGDLPMQGNNDAKVTMVEFSDFQCPFCKQYFDQTESQVYDTYVKTGKVKFFYRQFPLVTIHPNAYLAANAGECANEQGKFWQYHDLLFQNQDTWAPQGATDSANTLTDLAGQTGMDTDQFRSCLDNQKYKTNVDKDMTDGNSAQVDGTPTFFVNGFRVVGAVPFSDPTLPMDIKRAIEQELKKKG